MKRELSILGILPPESSEKLTKFTLTKFQFDSRTLRNLYERWNDEALLDLITLSQKELSKLWSCTLSVFKILSKTLLTFIYS